MGTIWVKEFTGGLDVRRLPETTLGGVLLQAVNGHISRGGEFEKRAAFVLKSNLATGTVGLGYNSRGLIVWGSGTRPAGLPSVIQYQQLVHPTNPALKLTAINSFDLYRDRAYVSATFEDGTTYHYYHGAIVADWVFGTAQFSFKVTGGQNVPGHYSVAQFKVTGGTKSADNKNYILRITIGGVQINRFDIPHTGNNNTTAIAVAAEINNWVSSPDYVASASGNTVTISARSLGTAANGKVVHIDPRGNLTIDHNDFPMAGGIDPVQSTIDLTVGGVDIMDPAGWVSNNNASAKAVVVAINTFSGVRNYRAEWDGANGVTIIALDPGTASNGLTITAVYTNGYTTDISASHRTMAGGAAQPTDPNTDTPYLPGKFAMTVGSKEYALSGPTMYFSKIGDPRAWQNPTTNTGAGFIDLSSYASGAEQLMSMALYQNNLAVFAMDSIQVWHPDSDPTKYSLVQVLYNTGTRSPHSVCQFGDNDIYYLDESGVRSLRARDSSNAAATSDIGVLVDPLVLAKLHQVDMLDRASIFGLIEPVDGRFWLIMNDLIFVFSYFPGAKVSAWSTYIPSIPTTDPDTGIESDVPFEISDAITFRRRIYVRSGDKVYCYGGEGSEFVYDRTEGMGQTPYLDGNAPGQDKDYCGLDVACDGVWEIDAYLDANNLEAADKVAVVEDSTFDFNRVGMTGRSTHVSLKFKSRSAKRAKVGSALIHYTKPDGEDDGSR